MCSIPVIDFSLFTSDSKEYARQICEASRDIGFFFVKNHGISQDLIDRMFKCSEDFFQRPLQCKNRYLINSETNRDNNGYTPWKSE
ncbi:hypothetical protein BX616_007198, partial [Lobosporangium transversale]